MPFWLIRLKVRWGTRKKSKELKDQKWIIIVSALKPSIHKWRALLAIKKYWNHWCIKLNSMYVQIVFKINNLILEQKKISIY